MRDPHARVYEVPKKTVVLSNETVVLSRETVVLADQGQPTRALVSVCAPPPYYDSQPDYNPRHWCRKLPPPTPLQRFWMWLRWHI